MKNFEYCDASYLQCLMKPLEIHSMMLVKSQYKKLFKTIPLLVLMLAASLVAGVWPQDGSDIPADPAVTWGVLANKVRYAIMRNAEPPEKVSLRILVEAGSLNENEKQRGLAHFLEHMAFKGIRSHPEERSMIEYFQSIGMSFGVHTNAHTSFNETVYKLELPNHNTKTVGDALTVLRDFADGMLFNQSSIDSERGVILSEKRDSYDVEERTRDALFEFVLPGTIIPKRFPIGIEEVISGAPRDQFVSFYKDWYSPERLVVVVVGDIDPAQMVDLIKKHFDSIPPSKIIKKDPDLGQLAVSNQIKVKVYTEKEATTTEINFIVVSEHPERKDTKAHRIENIHRSLAYGILNKRLNLLIKKEDAPFSSGYAGHHDFFNTFDVSEINFTCKPGKLKESLRVLEQEYRRVLQFGFTKDELVEVVASTLNAYEQAVKSAPTRQSSSLSTAIVSTISEDKVFASPETNLEIAKEALRNVTVSEVQNLFKADWAKAPMIFVSSNDELGLNESDIIAIYNESNAQPVTPQEEKAIPVFAYQSFGTPGNIVEKSKYEALDVYQYRFANNVRLNLKKTTFDADSISINVSFGLGNLELPKEKFQGLVEMTATVFKQGGLKAHSVDDLERIFAGKTVSFGFGVDEDAFVISGFTNNKDLQDQLNLMTAYLVAPGFREEAFILAKVGFEEFYRKINLEPGIVFSNKVDRYLANGDLHFGMPDKDILLGITKEDVVNWISPALGSGYMEISIVGDFDQERVIATVAKTLGALPAREIRKEKKFSDVIVTFPAVISEVKTFKLESEFEKAISAVYWPSVDQWDVKERRKLSVLTEVFNDRLRKELRGRLGQTYSPYASNQSYSIYKNYGRFFGVATVEAAQAIEAANIIVGIGDDLIKKGITESEFVRAKQPILTQIDQLYRSNSYWIGVLNDSQAYPEFLDWATNIKEAYGAISLKEIDETAKKYLVNNKAIKVSVIAQKKEATQDELNSKPDNRSNGTPKP